MSNRPWLRKRSLRLVVCDSCRMTFADPLPAEADASHYDQLGRPFYLSADKLTGDYAAVRFERELALLRRLCPGGDLLDVGCSTGAFLFQLHRRFPGDYRGVGVDVSRAALEYAATRGVRVIPDSFLEHDFGSLRFDAITLWAVAEHLPDPGSFIRRAGALLRPGGHCLVLVPNLNSLSCRWLGARYRYILPQHVNYFTRATLRGLLENIAGLRVVASGGSHFNPVVLWQDWRRGTDAEVADAERAALLHRTTRLKQTPWLAPARLALSGVEFALATSGMADNIWAAGRKPRPT